MDFPYLVPDLFCVVFELGWEFCTNLASLLTISKKILWIQDLMHTMGRFKKKIIHPFSITLLLLTDAGEPGA